MDRDISSSEQQLHRKTWGFCASDVGCEPYIVCLYSSYEESIWIAQREGRAKDSNDRTQGSVLKMLNMSGDKDIVSNLMELNIFPVAISYEYDPCDFLKAKEFQMKRDDPEFVKSAR